MTDLLFSELQRGTPVRHDNMKSGIVVQDNALVRSAYSMTLIEKRLLLMAISKIDATTAPKYAQLIQVTVTTDEWADSYRSNDPWSDLQKAASRLGSRNVTIYPSKSNQLSKLIKKRSMNWTDRCDYYENKVEIVFGYSISLELAGMLDKFTQIDLLDVAKLDSVYAVRLYEMLRQFNKTGELMITVAEFRQAMDVGDKYKQFGELNRRVVTQAVTVIQKRMPEMELTVDYMKRKGSRAVTSMKFTFKKKNQRDLFSEVDVSGAD